MKLIIYNGQHQQSRQEDLVLTVKRWRRMLKNRNSVRLFFQLGKHAQHAIGDGVTLSMHTRKGESSIWLYRRTDDTTGSLFTP